MERRRLSETRAAIVHKFKVGPVKGYIRVGLFDDGSPGEVFVNMGKSADAGTWGCIGILISMALQRGVSLADIVRKLSHTQFDPRGPTKNPDIPMATSVMDYVVRWMWQEFGDSEEAPSELPTSNGA